MHHSLLTYCRTRNIGDPIQSIAAWQHLPAVDTYADREFLSEFRPSVPTKLITNGWFCHRPWGFWINENVNPLFVSFHVNADPRGSYSKQAFSDALRNNAALTRHLKGFGPIGARDLPTAEFLQSLGVDSYVSGCLTLTLRRDDSIAATDDIVLADVEAPVADHVKASTSSPVKEVRHVLGKFSTPPVSFAKAENLLELYQSARLVITSRLHVAMPCLALQTPVLLVKSKFDDPRFAGLAELTNHFTHAEFARLPAGFFAAPPANPDKHMAYREALTERVRLFVGPAAAHGDGVTKGNSASQDIARIWREKGISAPIEFASRWLRRTQ